MSHSSPHDPGEPSSSLDWNAARAAIRRRLAGQLDPAETHELDDLVQEGCVRLLRASRREAVQDLDAMAAVIARRTFRDWLRRRYRHERLQRPLDDAPEITSHSPGEARYGDLIERIEFLVIEIFRREERRECVELARGWFEGRNWKQLADRLELSHAGVRKRWSRCLELPRRIFGADPDYASLFRRGADG